MIRSSLPRRTSRAHTCAQILRRAVQRNVATVVLQNEAWTSAIGPDGRHTRHPRRGTRATGGRGAQHQPLQGKRRSTKRRDQRARAKQAGHDTTPVISESKSPSGDSHDPKVKQNGAHYGRKRGKGADSKKGTRFNHRLSIVGRHLLDRDVAGAVNIGCKFICSALTPPGETPELGPWDPPRHSATKELDGHHHGACESKTAEPDSLADPMTPQTLSETRMSKAWESVSDTH